MPCHAALRCVALRCVALRHVTLRYVTLRYVTLRYVTLRYVTLRYVTLRYAMFYGTGDVQESSNSNVGDAHDCSHTSDDTTSDDSSEDEIIEHLPEETAIAVARPTGTLDHPQRSQSFGSLYLEQPQRSQSLDSLCQAYSKEREYAERVSLTPCDNVGSMRRKLQRAHIDEPIRQGGFARQPSLGVRAGMMF